MHDWFNVLQIGSYEASVRDLSLSRQTDESFVGNGRLSWDAKSGIKVFAETNGGHQLLLEPMGRIGQIVPRERHFSLTGWTSDLWEVQVNHIVELPSGSLGTDIAEWKFICESVRFYRNVVSEKNSVIWALLRNIDITKFPRTSIISDDNPFFGYSKSSFDWMSFETSFGQVIARRVDSQSVQVQIVGPTQIDELEYALESIRLAFGFAEGKAVDIVGHELYIPGQWSRKIYPSVAVTKNRFFPPLSYIPGDRGAFCEHMLAKAANFFHTKLGRTFSDRLRMCWAMSDGYGSPRMMTTCLAVEAITNKYKSSFKKEFNEFENEAMKFICSYITREGGKYSESFANRILSFFRNMQANTPKDILKEWSSSGHMGVDYEDIKAWDRIRNPIAHGELLANDPDISKWASKVYDHDRIGNLVNKLVLGAMNYEGPYYDHAEHRAKNFPSTQPYVLPQ